MLQLYLEVTYGSPIMVNIRDPFGSLKAKGSSKNCNVWVYSVIKHKQNTDNSSFSKPL